MFTRGTKKTPSLYRMSLLGGVTTKLISDIDSVVTFSPDRKQFAFLRGNPRQGEIGLWTANIDGTSERKIAAHSIPARRGVAAPAWSPAGDRIVYTADTAEGGSTYTTLAEVPSSGGPERRITSQKWWRIDHMGWLRDGSGLVLIAREQAASPAQIWYLSYPGGQSHKITNDLNDYRSLSLTEDSSALVTVESETTSNLWVVPPQNVAEAQQITSSRSDGIEGLAWTPNGRIIFAARGSDKLDLWIIDPRSRNARQLTTNSGNNTRPAVSADGRYVFFLSDRTGTDHIWRADLDGSNATQLTNGVGEKNPQCSPDGKWVVFQLAYGRSGIWRIPATGGEPQQLVDKPTRGMAISPDGKRIATSYFEVDAIKIGIYPFDGGEPEKILNVNTNYVRWTMDGRALLYADTQNTESVIRRYPIDGGTPTPVLDVSPDLVFYFAASWDDKLIAVARGTVIRDVVLISKVKDSK